MERYFTLEYWLDDSWYVGKLKEVPGIFSQGASLEELEEYPGCLSLDDGRRRPNPVSNL